MSYQDETFQRRERLLLDTALTLFREQGWESVTVAQVAAAAGIGKGTVYRHFSSKDGIYARIVLDFTRACLLRYRQEPLAEQPLKTMRRIIRLAFDLLNENPMAVQLCLHCERPEFQERLSENTRQEFCDLQRHYQQLFNQILEAAVAAGDIAPRPMEPLYWGVDATFQGVMARIAAGGIGARHPVVSRQTYFDQVADFILSGITGPVAPPGAGRVESKQ